MTSRALRILALTLILGSACRAATVAVPQPTPTASPSPSASASPTAAPTSEFVVCAEQPAAIPDGTIVGGLLDARADLLGEALGARLGTVSSRAELNRSASERTTWREQLKSDAVSAPLVVLIQAGTYQRETATELDGFSARTVVILPETTAPSTIGSRYPDTTLFLVTTATTDAAAALTEESATEIAAVLRGEARCGPLSGIAPSPTATAASTTASPVATTANSAASCGPSKARRPIRFTVEIDASISMSKSELTSFLLQIYCDRNGWTRSSVVSFATASSRTKGVTLIRMSDRAGVKKHCSRLLGEQASGNYSCASYAQNEIVLNHERWTKGASEFNAAGGSRLAYRRMVATHEMGHVLDLRHQYCTTAGGPAPVMMQQSITMTSQSTGKTCKPNSWPVQHEIDRLKRRWS